MVTPNRRDVSRSRVFPGPWLDVPSLLGRDTLGLTDTVRRGLASRASRWLDRKIQEHIRIYARFGGGQLPKLIHGSHTVEGAPANAQQLFDFLEKKVGLHPLDVRR
jgi:hypothetical protein